MNDLRFSTLLYRYFFFGWLFKDAGTGDVFERAAAARHNREQARWLPVYVMRWLWVGLLFYGIAGVVELILQAPVMSLLFYAASAISVSFTVTIGTAWLGMRGRQGLQ